MAVANQPKFVSSQTGAPNLSFDGDDTPIDEDTVMEVPAFAAALGLVTDTVASLRVQLMKNSEQGVATVVENDPRTRLLNSQINENMSSYNFKRFVVKDLLLYGRSLTFLERENEDDPNSITSLYPLSSRKVTSDVYTTNGYKFYGVYTYNSEAGSFNYDEDDLMNVIQDTQDGITAKGILTNYAKTLQLAINQREYEKNLLGNGAVPIGAIRTDKRVAPEVLNNLKQQFGDMYGGANNSGKTLFLESGLTYQQISSNPDNLQLDSSKKAMLGEIARMFNIPETMINSNANKYNSNEQNNIQFFQYGLKPVLSAFEAALDKELLLESEKEDGYFFMFDTDTIMQNTLQEKVTAYGALYDKGIYSYDETRHKFNMSDIKGEDFISLGLGSVLYYPESGKMKIPNLGVTGDLNDGVSNDVAPNNVDQNAGTPSRKQGIQKAPNTAKQQQSHQHKADNNALGGGKDG